MYLFIFQLLTHLSVVAMLIYGSWFHLSIAILVYFFTGCIGMTITYHRLLSHKSFRPIPGFEKFGTLCATLGGTGSSIAWVSIHREHHRFTDTEKDPHSPRFKKIFSIQFLSMFFKPHVRYVPDLLRSKFHVNVHRYYWLIHLIYATVLFTIDPFSVVYAYLFPSFLLWHFGSLINTVCHNGADEKSASALNNTPLGYIVWGEGYHLNHHNDPKNPNFSRSPKQLDIGYFLINHIFRSGKHE